MRGRELLPRPDIEAAGRRIVGRKNWLPPGTALQSYRYVMSAYQNDARLIDRAISALGPNMVKE